MTDILKLVEEITELNIIKAVFSVPYRKDAELLKVYCRPIGEKYQIESFSKTQAFHENVKSENIIIIDNNDISECTVWGNILTTTAMKKKIQGTVINGASRDFSFNSKTKYPLFSK